MVSATATTVKGSADKNTKPQAKPYACTWPGCNNAYARSEHLNRHRLNHEPIKIFTCDECPKIFVRSDLLCRHKDRHLRKQIKLGAAAAKSASTGAARRGGAGGVVRKATLKSIRPARSNSSSSKDEPAASPSPRSHHSASPPVPASIPLATGLLQSPFSTCKYASYEHEYNHTLPLPLPMLSRSTAATVAAQQLAECTSQERYQYLPVLGQARSTASASSPPAAPSSTFSLTSSEGALDSPRMMASSMPREMTLLNNPLTAESLRFASQSLPALLPPIREMAPMQDLLQAARQPHTCLSVASLLNNGTCSHLVGDVQRLAGSIH